MDHRTTCIGSSRLRRAQQTAELLFPGMDLFVFPSLGEDGALPENTPRGLSYELPSWEGFLRELCSAWRKRKGRYSDFVVVAHGTFIRNVISSLSGSKISPVTNLSGFAIDLSLDLKSGNLVPVGDVISLKFPSRQVQQLQENLKDEGSRIRGVRCKFQ
jgi:broad specificity phosphatase PhoE